MATTQPDLPLGEDLNLNATTGDLVNAATVFFAPFVVIPVSIILVRIVKYVWKIYQAKKYGYGIIISFR